MPVVEVGDGLGAPGAIQGRGCFGLKVVGQPAQTRDLPAQRLQLAD